MFSGVTLTKLYSDKGHEIQGIHTLNPWAFKWNWFTKHAVVEWKRENVQNVIDKCLTLCLSNALHLLSFALLLTPDDA